jgi:hypothetical protein
MRRADLRPLAGCAAALGLLAALTAGVAWQMQQLLPAMARVQGARSQATTDEKQAAVQADLCNSSNAVSTGLRADFFTNDQWNGSPALTRMDRVIDFTGKQEWLIESPLHLKAVRWTGWVKAPISGRYRFHVDAPATLTVANTVFAAAGAALSAPSIDLSAGRFYPIVLEVQVPERSDFAVRLEWTAPHGQRYVVPKALLFQPSETRIGSGSAS